MLGQRTYTITRQSGGSTGTDGIWTPGAESTLTIRGSWQPLTGRELEQLPEGYRERARAKLNTNAKRCAGN